MSRAAWTARVVTARTSVSGQDMSFDAHGVRADNRFHTTSAPDVGLAETALRLHAACDLPEHFVVVRRDFGQVGRLGRGKHVPHATGTHRRVRYVSQTP